MKNYDKIEVVEKGVDHIEEVEKFNPFHDALGRFSNKNGFSSYSANPNTKAGAMAIARSAAAGHGNTMNVHHDSYGETIRQNANWIGRGKQQSPRQQGAATLRSRVEPVAGLGGASATGASWQHQNQAQGRTTSGKQPAQPQKPAPAKQPQPQQAQQNPAQQQPNGTATTGQSALANHVANVQLRTSDKIAIAPRDALGRPTTSKTVAKNHDQKRVAGKDISDSVDVTQTSSRRDAIDQVAALQGWNKAPTVTDNLEVFQKATKQSGQLLVRTVHKDGATGKSSIDICKDTMGDGDAALGGGGGRFFGGGLYMVGASVTGVTGKSLGQRVSASQQHSFNYGDTQMMATVHPSAKIATPSQARQMQNDFYNMPYSKQAKYGNDYGAYIASKGYDGAQWHSRNDPYITMYNKSAMIFYAGVAD